MHLAVIEAKQARDEGEVPVGAVIVKNGVVIAKAHNQKEVLNNATCHAELIALQEAFQAVKLNSLEDCDLYVTLEPCMMCTGAISLSKIRKVYCAAKDPKGGFITSNYHVEHDKGINHRPEVEFGLLEEESSKILIEFFKERRKQGFKASIVRTKEALEKCFEIRNTVFVIEQNVPIEEEIDGLDSLDANCIHILATVNEIEAGTLRIIPKANKEFKIGRVAVLKEFRKHKIGLKMMNFAEKVIKNSGGNEVILEAQLQARGFYERLGYCEEGEIFQDAGIDHIKMRKQL